MQIGMIATAVAIPFTQFKACSTWHFQLRVRDYFSNSGKTTVK
jgi:hypothetical protein